MVNQLTTLEIFEISKKLIETSKDTENVAVADEDVTNKTQNKDLFMVTTTIKLYYAQKKRSIYNFI